MKRWNKSSKSIDNALQRIKGKGPESSWQEKNKIFKNLKNMKIMLDFFRSFAKLSNCSRQIKTLQMLMWSEVSTSFGKEGSRVQFCHQLAKALEVIQGAFLTYRNCFSVKQKCFYEDPVKDINGERKEKIFYGKKTKVAVVEHPRGGEGSGIFTKLYLKKN